MKVFVVMVWNYSETNLEDVFESREKAQSYIDLKLNEEKRLGFTVPTNYAIEEKEVR